MRCRHRYEHSYAHHVASAYMKDQCRTISEYIAFAHSPEASPVLLPKADIPPVNQGTPSEPQPGSSKSMDSTIFSSVQRCPKVLSPCHSCNMGMLGSSNLYCSIYHDLPGHLIETLKCFLMFLFFVSTLFRPAASAQVVWETTLWLLRSLDWVEKKAKIGCMQCIYTWCNIHMYIYIYNIHICCMSYSQWSLFIPYLLHTSVKVLRDWQVTLGDLGLHCTAWNQAGVEAASEPSRCAIRTPEYTPTREKMCSFEMISNNLKYMQRITCT